MGEKTILEQKVDTIMEWIKKQDDERCKKVVIGTFGRNSLRELIYDACDATGLSITEEESKKINRKLKEIIDKNLTETTKEIQEKMVEDDDPMYKDIRYGIFPIANKKEKERIYAYLYKISSGVIPNYDFDRNELKEIIRKIEEILNYNSKVVIKEFMDEIKKIDEDHNAKINNETVRKLKQDKPKLIIQINLGLIDLQNDDNRIYMHRLIYEMANRYTRPGSDLFRLFKVAIKENLEKLL